MKKIIKQCTGQTTIKINQATICYGENQALNMICRGGYPLYVINDDLSRTDRFIRLLHNQLKNDSVYIITTEDNREELESIANTLKNNDSYGKLCVTKKPLANIMLANKNTVRIGGGMFLNSKADFPSALSIKDDYLYEYYRNQFFELSNDCEVIYENERILSEGLFEGLDF